MSSSFCRFVHVMMETVEVTALCFPQLLNASCEKIVRPLFDTTLLYMVLSLISVLTAILNLLVIVSISHYKQLQTPTNFLLLSLAVSDSLVGLVMCFQTLLIDGCWVLGDLMCILYIFVDYVITSSSVGTMVLISVDRYVAICDPLHYSSIITEQRVKFCICLCWLCSALRHTVLLKDNLEEPGRFNSCIGECVIFINYVVGFVDVVLSFIGPLTVIIFLYMRVFVVAVTQARAMRSHVTSAQVQGSVSVSVQKSELKAATTLGVVVLAFIICLCPFYFVAITGQDILLNTSSAGFVICLFYFNSCLNPVIYAFFYPWFRKSLKLIVTLQILQRGSSETKIL